LQQLSVLSNDSPEPTSTFQLTAERLDSGLKIWVDEEFRREHNFSHTSRKVPFHGIRLRADSGAITDK